MDSTSDYRESSVSSVALFHVQYSTMYGEAFTFMQKEKKNNIDKKKLTIPA